MEEMSMFKLFKTGSFYGLGQIYAIITGSKKTDESMIKTEWYYYVQTEKKALGFSINSHYFETIEKFWECVTIVNLKQAIYHKEIVPICKKINDYSTHHEITLTEIKGENLFYINIENKEFIDFLKKHTNCKSLMDLLNCIPLIEIIKTEIK